MTGLLYCRNLSTLAYYVYRCDECGEKFEKSHPIYWDKPVHCEECGSNKTHRIPQLPGIIFATTGFFHIDSGKRFESQLSERGKQVWAKSKAKAGVS